MAGRITATHVVVIRETLIQSSNQTFVSLLLAENICVRLEMSSWCSFKTARAGKILTLVILVELLVLASDLNS